MPSGVLPVDLSSDIQPGLDPVGDIPLGRKEACRRARRREAVLAAELLVPQVNLQRLTVWGRGRVGAQQINFESCV